MTAHGRGGWALILLICFLGLSNTTFAQVGPCGEAPAISDERLKGELDSKANILSGYLGNAKFKGQVEFERNDVLQHYPHADKLRLNQYYLFTVCLVIMADKAATLEQKIKMLNEAQETISSPASARSEWIHPQSFGLVANDLAVPLDAYGGTNAVLSFSVDNRSGVDVGAALRSDGFAAGPCTSVVAVAGLPLISSADMNQLSNERDPAKRLRWFPSGQTISAAASMPPSQCYAGMLAGLQSVPIAVNLVVASGRDIVTLPLSGAAHARFLQPPGFVLPYSTR